VVAFDHLVVMQSRKMPHVDVQLLIDWANHQLFEYLQLQVYCQLPASPALWISAAG